MLSLSSAFRNNITGTGDMNKIFEKTLIKGNNVNLLDVQTITGTSLLKVDSSTSTITLNGNVNILGALTSYTSTNVQISDCNICLAFDNPANLFDIGFYGSYVSSGRKWWGVYRKSTDGDIYLFKDLTTEPTTTVTTSYSLANLRLADMYSSNGYISSKLKVGNSNGDCGFEVSSSSLIAGLNNNSNKRIGMGVDTSGNPHIELHAGKTGFGTKASACYIDFTMTDDADFDFRIIQSPSTVLTFQSSTGLLPVSFTTPIVMSSNLTLWNRTTAQVTAISSSVGMMVFNTTTNRLSYRDSSAWRECAFLDGSPSFRTATIINTDTGVSTGWSLTSPPTLTLGSTARTGRIDLSGSTNTRAGIIQATTENLHIDCHTNTTGSGIFLNHYSTSCNTISQGGGGSGCLLVGTLTNDANYRAVFTTGSGKTGSLRVTGQALFDSNVGFGMAPNVSYAQDITGNVRMNSTTLSVMLLNGGTNGSQLLFQKSSVSRFSISDEGTSNKLTVYDNTNNVTITTYDATTQVNTMSRSTKFNFAQIQTPTRQTADYSLSATSTPFQVVDTGVGDRIVTLPDISTCTSGQMFYFYKSSIINTLQFNRTGADTINGVASASIAFLATCRMVIVSVNRENGALDWVICPMADP